MMHAELAKNTSWYKATSNSEEIQPIALTIVELCLTELVENSVKQKKFYEVCWKGLRLVQRHLWAWLCVTNTSKLSFYKK